MWLMSKSKDDEPILGEEVTVPKIKMCGNCTYWKRIEMTMNGHCHRYPPTPMDSVISRFSITNKYIKCGEWDE